MIAVLLLSIQLWAVTPPSSTADLYFQKAMSMSEQELQHQGRNVCVDAIQPEPSLKGYGNTLQNAQTHFILKCMRKRCETLDEEVAFEKNEILDGNTSEVTELLRFHGIDPEFLGLIRSQNRPAKSSESQCQNSTSLTRMLVFDACASRPLSCN